MSIDPVATLTTRIARPDDEVAAHLARPAIVARLTPPWFPPNTIFDDRALTTRIDPDGQSACLLTETIRLMPEIDQAIESRGGWPEAFASQSSDITP